MRQPTSAANNLPLLLPALGDCLLGSLTACGATALLLTLLALCIGLFEMGAGPIAYLNTLIKALSLLVGCYMALRKRPARGYLKGIACGALYSGILYGIFALVEGAWPLQWAALWDLLLTAAMGAAAGVVAVNVRRRRL